MRKRNVTLLIIFLVFSLIFGLYYWFGIAVQ
ncbi:hypothetical protein SAMN05421687_101197 [Salimicrobium flavidum]|uniref:Uncharacterized protein n=1 Tax=Salimicrobium flavidum TaxID=570947 RepID=A0A1N7IIZ8_9BACI|nr:hypothetical protein SAMN05421687_101197 [Salimicrobium flavidum]